LPQRPTFLGVRLDPLTLAETLARIRTAILSRQRLHHVALNVVKFVHLQRDPVLAADVVAADIVGVDAMGILLAASLVGPHIPARVAGVDLMDAVLALATAEGFRPYLLGAKPAVLAAAEARRAAADGPVGDRA
jgi:N-acetylglucosaminyldiphosphoundecaprenol N-acetyl-beta-D-mannosaminyltransferase